jgi:hypothetical protein
MTVAWADIKTALVAFIASTNTVAADHVYFQDESHPIMQADTIELSIRAERAVGFDDLSWVEQPDGRLVARITGMRECILSIRYQTRDQVFGARTALEKIRACFHHPGRLEILEGAGISFLTTEMEQAFDGPFADRVESVGVIDVRLAVLSELYEPDLDVGMTPIEAVGMTVGLVGHDALTEPFTVTKAG